MREKASLVAQKQAAFRKKSYYVISAVFLIIVFAGLYVFYSKLKERPANPYPIKEDMVKVQNSTSIQPAYQEYAAGPDISSPLHSEDQESPLPGKVTPETATARVCLEGDCLYGYGVYIIPDIGKYLGEWKDGKRHGKGTFISINGSIYEGEWINDKTNGFGVLIDKDGNKYVGEWTDGKKHGQGTLLLSDGNKYEGEFRFGEKFGTGTMIFPNGDKYTGEWKDDKIHGYGIFINAEGIKHAGKWENGALVVREGTEK